MKSRLLILVVVLGISAVVFGWVYESKLRPRIETHELEVPDNIDSFFANLDYRSIDDEGRLDYEFKSPRVEHYPRGDVSRIETPSVQIYSDPDAWKVDALEGEFLHADNLLRLRRQVVMERGGADPMQVFTESIRFEPDKELVSSEASVVIESRQGRIEAERASFDLAAGVYRFTNSRGVYRRDGS